jgi:hypothetical protein
MTPLTQGGLVFVASYFSVLLLGLQSKLMRDDHWQVSFFVSWLIMLSHTAVTWSVANNSLGIPLYLFISGWGSSLGIVSSHFLYIWYDNKFHKNDLHSE